MSESIVPFSKDLAQQFVNSQDQCPVDFDLAWQWLGYSRKDAAKRAFEKCEFTEIIDYSQFHQSVELGQGGSTYKEVIKLSVECFKTWAMMSHTDQGKQIRLYFLECEKIAKAKINTPTTYIDALKALVAAEEQKALLEAERALLEQTNAALSEAVDELFNYSSIIRVAKFNNLKEAVFSWHRLKAATKQLGLEVKKVPSARYEYQLLYPHDAWRLAYPGVALPETTTLVISTKAI